MIRITIRPSAQRDPFAIWQISAETWDAEQANRYLETVDTAIQHLAVAPDLAVRCDRIRAGYHRLKVKSHFVFLKRIGKDMIIMRVLHERMNFPDHLADTSAR